MADRPVAVQVTDLHKKFGELEVLKGVSLTAREGSSRTTLRRKRWTYW